MSIANIVNQLRRLQIFNGRVVAGAVEQIENYQFAALPAAIVVPLGDDASDNESMTGTWQTVTQHVGIVVVFPTSGVIDGSDRRGQAVAEIFDVTKFSIFRALLNWSPYNRAEAYAVPGDPTQGPLVDLSDPIIGHAARGFRYAGCGLVAGQYGLDRVAYRFDFAIEYTISELDGWTVSGIPLEQIDIRATDQDTDDLLVEVEVTDLQA